jgi:nucleoid DNA-binding protein
MPDRAYKPAPDGTLPTLNGTILSKIIEDSLQFRSKDFREGRKIYKAIIKVMTKALRSGDNIQINGIGKLYRRRRKYQPTNMTKIRSSYYDPVLRRRLISLGPTDPVDRNFYIDFRPVPKLIKLLSKQKAGSSDHQQQESRAS